jgi:hypothetical protein
MSNKSNKNFDNNTDQFTLSFELLRLFQWLVEHDIESLRRLINRSMAQGLNDSLGKLREAPVKQQDAQEIQHSIIEFFVVLETLLYESINEHSAKNSLQRSLIPAVNRIDTSGCDTSTVRFSLERATAQIAHKPQENPHDLLMKELIKRWKPHKKSVAN